MCNAINSAAIVVAKTKHFSFNPLLIRWPGVVTTLTGPFLNFARFSIQVVLLQEIVLIKIDPGGQETDHLKFNRYNILDLEIAQKKVRYNYLHDRDYYIPKPRVNYAVLVSYSTKNLIHMYHIFHENNKSIIA